MKKIIQILPFFITFSVGIFSFSLFLPSHLNQKSNIPLSYLPEITSIVTNTNKEISKSQISTIKPCVGENTIKPSKYDGKNEGFIKGGVLNGKILCGELLEYHQDLRDKHISKDIIVDVQIDETGEVRKAQARNGNPLLIKAAVKAAYRTRFSPTLLGGEIYQVEGVLIYKFDTQTVTNLKMSFEDYR